MAAESSVNIRFGIFPRLLAILLLVSLIPLLAVWYIDYSATTARVDQQVNQDMRLSLRRLTGYIDSWVEMNNRMLLQNAEIPEIRSMEAPRQDPILATITDKYPWAYLAFTVAPDGKNVGRSDGKPPKYYGDRTYVKEVLGGAPYAEDIVIGKTSGKPAFIMAAPIHASPTLAGVIAIAMTIEEMSNQVANAKIGNTGYAFLVDKDGRVIAHPSEEYNRTRQDLSDHPAVKAAFQGKDHLVYTDEQGKRVIAYTDVTERGWITVVQQDYDEAFADLAITNRNAMILLGVTVLPVILVAFAASRSLSVPIRRLTEITDAISMGTMDLQIREMQRKDEIGVLASAIDRLRTSMELAMARLNRPRS